MAPLEQMIWEAKLKPGTLKNSRRPSTTVDDTGCVITRGFVIPSRSSSIDSIARTSVSSLDTPGTPASPVGHAPARSPIPTDTPCDVPELHALKTHSPAAICRPSKSDGNLTTHFERPTLGDRRRTWQVDRVACSISQLRRGSSSRWNDDELAEAMCQPDPPDEERSRRKVLMQAQARPVAIRHNKGHARRLTTARVKPSQLHFLNDKPKHQDKPGTFSSKSINLEAAQNLRPETAPIADAAIASDSEGDFLSDDDGRASMEKVARPDYANYAERRARADGKVGQYHLSAHSVLRTASPSENAIESDDDEDDIVVCTSDRKISARLSLAQFYCAQNALTTKIDSDQLVMRRKSPLSVSIALTALNKLTIEGQSMNGGNTPAYYTTNTPDAYVADSELQQSRTSPRPVKRVLKNPQMTET